MGKGEQLASICKGAGSASLMVMAFAVAMLSAAAHAATPVEWENLDQTHHLAGRMASAGYLRGKVVCLDCRDYGDKSGVDAMRRLEEVWQAFKMKQFVLVGSHRGTAGAEKIRRIAEGLKLTFPIYKDADVVHAEKQNVADTRRVGFVCIIDGTGRTLYRGADDRHATGVIVDALISMCNPTAPKQWKHYIDYCIDVLPGRAYLEMAEFRKAFPEDAAVYDEVWMRFDADKDIRRVAKLERIAQQAKDHDFKDANAKRLNLEKVEKAIALSADLKKSENQFVAQEAKNCIADLMWTAAMLKPAAEISTKQGER